MGTSRVCNHGLALEWLQKDSCHGHLYIENLRIVYSSVPSLHFCQWTLFWGGIMPSYRDSWVILRTHHLTNLAAVFDQTHPSIFNTLLSASRKTLLAPKQVFLHTNLGFAKNLPHENTQPINQSTTKTFPNQPSQINHQPYKNSVSRHWCMTPWFSCTKPGSGTMWVLVTDPGVGCGEFNSFP